MSNAIYASIGRQAGLMEEMKVVANNLANSSTTGYKADRSIFAEFVTPTGTNSPSLSMGVLAGHAFELTQSSLNFSGGQFDLALQGEGYFVVQTEQGERLTRAGHFQLSAEGKLINGMGHAVMGAGGGEITIPETATKVNIAGDGTISADGEIVGQVSIATPNGQMQRDSNTMFIAEGGYSDAETGATIIQGALEQSNVSPVLEISRMIEVQRAYEAGQALLEREDKRLTQLIDAVRER